MSFFKQRGGFYGAGFLLLLGFIQTAPAWAGPPFQTDDPEPVEYQHWEIFFAASYARVPGGADGTGPQFDINYGFAPEVHVNLVCPFAFNSPDTGTQSYGYGDTELGVKLRFLKETADFPQAAIYPRVIFPTGDSSKGLGSGQPQFLFPLWLQKSWGAWTSFGGGGYWVNPGSGNRDWIFLGWEIQRDLSSLLTLGLEGVYHSASQLDDTDHLGFNGGGILNLDPVNHLMLSLGKDLFLGNSQLTGYAAYQVTF